MRVEGATDGIEARGGHVLGPRVRAVGHELEALVADVLEDADGVLEGELPEGVGAEGEFHPGSMRQRFARCKNHGTAGRVQLTSAKT